MIVIKVYCLTAIVRDWSLETLVSVTMIENVIRSPGLSYLFTNGVRALTIDKENLVKCHLVDRIST
jgi:hypothetical protein